MKNNKYKILVLSDLKDSTNNLLENTVSLSKMIGGEISLFHVKKPTDIVERESQLSAFRTINEKHSITNKRIETLVNNVKDNTNGTKINYSHVFGNVKSEIEDYILKNKPDLVLLGKRKPKAISFGDNITDFVLKIFGGMVLIVDDEKSIEFNNELSIGLLDGKQHSFNTRFTDFLFEHCKKPLISFKFVNKSDNINEKKINTDSKFVEYVFERNDSSIQNLSNYVTKSNINLLLVDNNFEKGIQNGGLNQSDVKSVINQLNIPLILFNKRKHSQAV